MSIAQPQQCQVIDIRNKDTKVHVSGYKCTILTKEHVRSDVAVDDHHCKYVVLGDNQINIDDIILAEDINLKIVFPFKIKRFAEFNLTKDIKRIELVSFEENPTSLFLAPMVGSLSFSIIKSPLFIGIFAYYPELESEKFRYALHYLLNYNKTVQEHSEFTKLKELVNSNSYDDLHISHPFDNPNYIVFSKNIKYYWQDEYNGIIRGHYSSITPAYMSHLRNHLSERDYEFITSIVEKKSSLISVWEDMLKIKLPPTAELYEAFDLEGKDGLYEHNLISKEDYERIKRMAGYMV